ncbi:Protein FAR1-RELATED SEQUENCE 4 [Linum perenne]
MMFGAALLYDETIPSFICLFKEFILCMHDKIPNTIFKYKDQAMTQTIKEVLSDTFHAHCTFHVLQDSRRNLGSLFTHNFIRKLLLLFYDMDNEAKFDDVWNIMFRECFLSYGEEGHKWCKYIRAFRV